MLPASFLTIVTLLFLGLQPPARVEPQAELSVDVPLVLISVQVTTPLGNAVAHLTLEDFRLFEDNAEQRITYFSKEDAPLSVGLLFDASGSMRNKMRKSMAAVSTFFQTANPEDEFFLIEFNERPRLLLPFTQNLNTIRARLARVKPFGRTALLDAIRLALSEMKSARNTRKAILILSDGGDNRSRHTETEIARLASESDAQVYSMGIFDPEDSPKRTREERNGPRLLNELAGQTGGRHFPVQDLDELPDICARIGAEFRNQYVLGYSPANAGRDGKYRQVRVLVAAPAKGPAFRVHHRPGYYAPSR
jgi:VWFA-related protein